MACTYIVLYQIWGFQSTLHYKLNGLYETNFIVFLYDKGWLWSVLIKATKKKVTEMDGAGFELATHQLQDKPPTSWATGNMTDSVKLTTYR